MNNEPNMKLYELYFQKNHWNFFLKINENMQKIYLKVAAIFNAVC